MRALRGVNARCRRIKLKGKCSAISYKRQRVEIEIEREIEREAGERFLSLSLSFLADG